MSQLCQFLELSKCNQKDTSKWRRFFTHENYVEHDPWKLRQSFIYRNYTERKFDFLPIETMWKKVRWNDMDFSPIKITSKKVCPNNVNFPLIEIAWKFVDIFLSTYQRKIDVDSTCCVCWDTVLLPLCLILQKWSKQMQPTICEGWCFFQALDWKMTHFLYSQAVS